jgi:serine/threonine protein kinase
MAIKVLHEQFSMGGEIGARARDEARLMSQLNHDNVVQVFGLTQIGKRSAVLMEYVEGVDCGSLIRHSTEQGKAIPLSVAARIIECTADALHAAYNTISPQTGRPLRVVHRDIKPGNILVSHNGTVKVMDFGVARADFEREAVTKSHQFGTQRYMAPERWLEGEAVAKSDVFSLGMSFWELVTGEKFAQVPLSPRKYAERLDENVLIFSDHAKTEGKVKAGCESLLRGMLAYSVDKRFSAQEVSEVLGEISELQPGPSLRRFSRRWIPALLEQREAVLALDPDLAEFSGTMSTSAKAELSGAVEVVPVEARDDSNLEPDLSPPIIDAPPSNLGEPTNLEEGRSPNWAFFVAFGLALTVGGAWIVKGSKAVDEGPQELKSELPAASIGPVADPVETADLKSDPRIEPPSISTPQKRTPRAVEPIEKSTEAVLKRVTLKVLADPREGSVVVGDQIARVSESVVLPIGVHQFNYTGEGWAAFCEAAIEENIRKIKFVKGTGSCVLLP